MLTLVEVVSGLGYQGIFILMAMESSLFPVPSELVMPPAGYLAQQGLMNPWIVIFVGTAGSLVGAYANYYIAHYLGRPVLLKYGRYLFISPDKLYRIERFFLRHGEIATFIGRLLPVFRHLISIPAGLAGMNHLRFSLYTLLGSFIWCSVLTWIGYVIGRNQELILMYSRQAVIWASIGSCLLVVAYLYYHKRETK